MDNTLQNALKLQAFEAMDETAEYAVAHKESLEHVHDTQEITELYMQRPPALSGVSLGAWFCQAHELQDPNLATTAFSCQAKKLIISMGYNRMPLEPLQELNQKWTVK